MSESVASVDGLPAEARAWLAQAEREEFQLGAGWFSVVAAHARPPGGAVVFLLHRENGHLRVVLPLWRHPDGTRSGLTAPYSCVFRPLVAEGADGAALARAGLAFGRAVRGGGTLRLDALDPEWPGLAPLLAGFRAAGLLPLRFAHFGAWWADLTGQNWDTYLAGRPGALRETIRRRLARAERDAALRFELIGGGDRLAAGIAAYQQVQARSWKPAEPFADFVPALLPVAAAAGVLRLGLLWRDGVPVAAQYWTVAAGTARLDKLVHDAAEHRAAPGTVLTAWMLRHLLTRERLGRIDFGRGDDAYKAGWTGQRRQHIGVLLCAPWHPAGLYQLGRHLAGRARARVRWRDVGDGKRTGGTA
jgi:CelD/BcsL family acetyltransferase involved in cellulose biosynthesis